MNYLLFLLLITTSNNIFAIDLNLPPLANISIIEDLSFGKMSNVQTVKVEKEIYLSETGEEYFVLYSENNTKWNSSYAETFRGFQGNPLWSFLDTGPYFSSVMGFEFTMDNDLYVPTPKTLNKRIHKFFCRKINDPFFWSSFINFPCNGMHKVGFTQANSTMQK